MKQLFCLFVLFLSYGNISTHAATFESPNHRVLLLELYTSEGCSSCPPAEAWLAKLQNDPTLWKDYVPVAFHVTYWDRLGWKDSFASESFTDRQRDYIFAWKGDVLYTPCFVSNGKAWNNRFSSLELRKPDPGKLILTSDDKKNFTIFFTPSAKGNDYQAHLALLGFGIESDIKSGENAGSLLKHDFVALAYEKKSLDPKGNQWQATLTLPKASQVAPRYGVAAWITQEDDPSPIQVVGGYLM
jgi:hypothetical protein